MLSLLKDINTPIFIVLFLLTGAPISVAILGVFFMYVIREGLADAFTATFTQLFMLSCLFSILLSGVVIALCTAYIRARTTQNAPLLSPNIFAFGQTMSRLDEQGRFEPIDLPEIRLLED